MDVRSSPYSSYYDAYNKENIEVALKKAGIYYRNYAREFGARQENPDFYTNGILDFRKFTNSQQFADGNMNDIYMRADNPIPFKYSYVLSYHSRFRVPSASLPSGMNITILCRARVSSTR